MYVGLFFFFFFFLNSLFLLNVDLHRDLPEAYSLYVYVYMYIGLCMYVCMYVYM